jgi:hypothetical protein
MNDSCDPEEINRAVNIMLTAYHNPCEAISKAKRVEDSLRTAFSRLVREEIERRCLAYSTELN